MRHILAVAVFASMASTTARSETPSFFLDLDTGGHRAFIKDIAATPDGELLVSASDDKTIRVWDWRSGVTIRTIRGEIGPGNAGKVFAVDVSPDGATIAAGGWFTTGQGDQPPYGDIRLFDLKSGRLTGLLHGNEYPVYDLAFSPGGDFLAAGGQDGYVHVWRRDDSEDTGWSAHGTLDADSLRVEKIAFAFGGERLVAATADNGLRLFDMASGQELAMPAAEPLRDVPFSALAVSPDGTVFATGGDDGIVRLWRAGDGDPITALPARDHRIGALSFSADGARLIAACGYRCAGANDVAVWTVAALDAPPLEFTGHDNVVMASASLPASTGGLIATAGGERYEIHLWNPETRKIEQSLRGSGAPIASLGISADAGRIGWGTENPCPLSIACPDALGTLARAMLLPTPDRGFETPEPIGDNAAPLLRAVTRDGEWSLAHAEGGGINAPHAVLEIARDDKVVHRIVRDETNGFVHSAYSLLADGRALVSGGGDGTLILYDRETGMFAGELSGGHSGEILSVAEAPQARLLATGSADQTIRLWNLESMQLIASLFFTDTEWIVWTPQGYYFSSPSGDGMVGWHINQGPDKEARYVTARQLRQHLNSPEIVRRAILTGDAAAAARELRGTDQQLDQLLRRRPPDFEIRLAEGVTPADGHIAIEIVGAAEAGADVSSFTVLSNDRRIDDFVPRAADGPGGSDRMIIEVPVVEGENEVLISGVNEFGYITERGVRALATKQSSQAPKGKLYVIAIGINEYPLLTDGCSGRSCDLRFPVADAAEFMRLVAERTAPLHAEMEGLLLVNQQALDEDADRAAMLYRLVGEDRVLEPESRTIRDEIIDFLDLPGPEDTTIIFIAGHGLNIDEEYYVIPSDGRRQDGDRWRRSSLVAWSDIHEAIERASGRRLMLLDTCHAAGAFNANLEKEAADARIAVLAATAANNVAAELTQLGHGVFTHAVLEGMRGAAGSGDDGVRILGLSDYIDREVRRLTNSRQEPFYHLPRTENFLVARP